MKNKKWGEDFDLGRGGFNFSPNKGPRYSSGKSWVSNMGLNYRPSGVLKRKDQPGKATGLTGSDPKDPNKN